MFHRILSPVTSNSFFLFGPRGTGKSTLLKTLIPSEKTISIDLLDPIQEDLFRRSPQELEQMVKGSVSTGKEWVIIDEIQKAPRLLDLVHRLMESTSFKFALTGSSARKLKRGASNLLAGRAFVYHLFPLSFLELGKSFHLNEALRWGTLPKIFQYTNPEEKSLYLQSYALTYLKEEIVAEQLVRKLDPFRNFLEVAAQCNGQILNYSKIGKDIGADTKTVQGFFSILDETLIGFLLPAFHRSVRKRQRANPKFYFFDLGVKRALERTLSQDIYPRTSVFGDAFEHFMIIEIVRLSAYARKEWRFSYLRTKDGAEVDLIIDRPGQPTALVEIKSADHIVDQDVASLNRFQSDIKPSEAYCFSLDLHRKQIGDTLCLPWQEGLAALGLIEK